jgi:hypothetical protein
VVSAATRWEAEAEAAGISAAERRIVTPTFAALDHALSLTAT